MADTPFQSNPNPNSTQEPQAVPVEGETVPSAENSEKDAPRTEAELQNDQEGDLQVALVTMQTELRAMTETAKRAMADLQNVRRHHEEEKARLNLYANLKLLEAIFPAIDNFDRALATQPQTPLGEDWSSWLKGLLSTGQMLLKALENMGLEVIDQINVPMDPFRHEVLMQGDGPAGQVLQIFEKGYAFRGEVVRPAKVMVGKAA